MFTLAHCSDLHATPPVPHSPVALAGKRFFGWLSWNVKRGRVHRPEVLRALIDDLHEQAPDHVAVTGDLTNVSTLSEFREAATWLERLGSPRDVTAVPGNHDAYVRVSPHLGWDHWAPYLSPDAAADDAPPPTTAPRWQDYPVLRVRGPVALVGLCSAQPTPWFRATGRLGTDQLERLEALLGELADRGLFRVLLLHHPATETRVSARRRLVDSRELRAVLARTGAELLLHGHVHRHVVDHVEGPAAPVPCVGVRSASHAGEHPSKQAQYHLYDLAPGPEGRLVPRMRLRGWDPELGRFRDQGEGSLAPFAEGSAA